MSTSDSALALGIFRLFLTARSISWFGNAVTLVALPMLVFQMTASPAMTGLVAAFEALPYLLFGLIAGALADRWDRKRVLVVTGTLSGLTMASIPGADALGALTVGHVFAAALTVSTIFVFFDAASFGALPEIVGRDKIASATGTMISVSTLINLLGPAVGGLLAATLGPVWVLGLDAAAYLVAAVMTATLTWASSLTGTPDRLSVRRLTGDITEGLRYIWDVRIIRLLTLIGAGASFSGGAMSGLMIVVGVQHLQISDDDARLGLLYTATALGAFLISLALAAIQRRVPTGWITLIALGVSWVAQMLWSTAASIPIALSILVIFQAASTLSIANGIVVRQSLTPDHLQGRVNTTARMIAWGGSPLGATAGGLLAEHVDLTVAILICSTGTLVGLLLALSTRIWTVPLLASLRAETRSAA